MTDIATTRAIMARIADLGDVGADQTVSLALSGVEPGVVFMALQQSLAASSPNPTRTAAPMLRGLAADAVPGPWTYEDMGQTILCRAPDFLGGASNSPGPFKVADIRGWGFLQYRPDGQQRMDATGNYIAAANPAAILAILDRLDALERVAEAARGISDPGLDRLRGPLAALDQLDTP